MNIGLIIVCVIFGLFFIFTLCGVIIEAVKRIKSGKDDISNESSGDPTGDPEWKKKK